MAVFGPLPRLGLLAAAIFVSVALLIGTQGSVCAFDPDQAFSPWTKAVSMEATFTHFGSRLNNGDAAVQAWNLSGRFALLPLGITRFKFLGGVLDGAAEIGLEPTFERFNTQHQNFAGVGLHLRYDMLHFRWGPLVPWIDVSIAPGGTDLRIGRASNETRLDGPFMNLIQAGVGESYFREQPHGDLSRYAGAAHLQCRSQWQQPELRAEHGRELRFRIIVVPALVNLFSCSRAKGKHSSVSGPLCF